MISNSTSIVQTDRLVNVLSHRAVLLDEENAVFNGIGEVMLGQAKFAQRAQHAVALYAAELALLMRTPPGSSAPIIATGTSAPSTIFWAPVTI